MSWGPPHLPRFCSSAPASELGNPWASLSEDLLFAQRLPESLCDSWGSSLMVGCQAGDGQSLSLLHSSPGHWPECLSQWAVVFLMGGGACVGMQEHTRAFARAGVQVCSGLCVGDSQGLRPSRCVPCLCCSRSAPVTQLLHSQNIPEPGLWAWGS